MNNLSAHNAISPSGFSRSLLVPVGGALVILFISAWLFHLHVVVPPCGNFQTDLRAHLLDDDGANDLHAVLDVAAQLMLERGHERGPCGHGLLALHRGAVLRRAEREHVALEHTVGDERARRVGAFVVIADGREVELGLHDRHRLHVCERLAALHFQVRNTRQLEVIAHFAIEEVDGAHLLTTEGDGEGLHEQDLIARRRRSKQQRKDDG